jgi:hypothetical protein
MMALQCRLCLDEDVWVNLIRPCKCDGSIRYAHQTCLERYEAYRAEQGQQVGKCPVCNTTYKYLNRTAWKVLSLQILLFLMLFTQPFTLERIAVHICLITTFCAKLHSMETSPWQHLLVLQLLTLPAAFLCLFVPANALLPLTSAVATVWNLRLSGRGTVWCIAHIYLIQTMVLMYIYGDLTCLYIHILCLCYMQIMVLSQ